MAVASQERSRSDLVRLVHHGLGVRDFSMAAARILRRAVPFDGVCVMTMDPATLLPTGHVIENGLPDETTPRLAEIELQEPDFNKFTELARRRPPVASLSEATGGDLNRSRRQRELRRPHGFEDELRAALTTDSGTWGGLVLMRESGRPHFAPADAKLLASLTGDLAEGLRRALLLTALSADEDELGPACCCLRPTTRSSSPIRPRGPGSPSSRMAATQMSVSRSSSTPPPTGREASPPGKSTGTPARALGSGPDRAAGCSCADRCSATGPRRVQP